MTISTDFTASLLSLLFFVVAAYVCYVFMLQLEEHDDDPLGSGGQKKGRFKGKGIFLKLFGPLVVVLAEIVALVPLGKKREVLKAKLVAAGSPGGLSVDEYNAARIIGIVLALGAGVFIDGELDVTPMFTIILSLLGFLYPDIWLSGAVQKRRRRIFRDLPDTLDTLRLSVDAGLDLSSAMKVVVEKGRKGPLLHELEQVEREISLGRTRKEAFKNFSDRIGMAEVNSFVLALIQADQLGASVGPVLKVQADMARTKRWQVAEEIVNKMPMKMLGPLVLFIFPASFIVLFTPLLIQWMQSD